MFKIHLEPGGLYLERVWPPFHGDLCPEAKYDGRPHLSGACLVLAVRSTPDGSFRGNLSSVLVTVHDGVIMAVDVRYGLAGRFFRNAIFSAREAVRIEKAGRESEVSAFYARIGVANNEAGFAVGHQDPHWPGDALRSYACSAVLFGTSSIEAWINNFFVDAEERARHLRFLGDGILHTLDMLWNCAGVRRWTSPLEKIQLALQACGRAEFDPGQSPYQDAHLMFSVRNHLVHFEPDWTSNLDRHAKLEAGLRTKNLRPSPFAADHEPYFPGNCLAADLAIWCVHTTYKLIAEFLDRVGDAGAIRSWKRQEYYIREFADWESYARWEADGGPPWSRD